MKSKKIVAMIVAFAAFMAVATSGLAQVTTITTYNTGSDKVVVDVDVTGATPSSEVTYLVKSNDQIVYIDQDTASAEGAVSFDYKVAKDKLSTLSADVTIGTNGAAIDQTGKDVILANTSTTKGDATVEYFKDEACTQSLGDAAIVGGGEIIYAAVTVDPAFVITSVKVNGEEQDPLAGVYAVTANQAVEVTTEAAQVEGYASAADEVIIEDDFVPSDGTVAVTRVLRVVGSPAEVGVEYAGVKYAAYSSVDFEAEDGEYFTEADGLCAVRIIFNADEAPEADELVPYPANNN